MSAAFMHIGGRGRSGTGRRGKTMLLLIIYYIQEEGARREPVRGKDGIIVNYIYIGGRSRAGASRRGKTKNLISL